MAFSPSVRLAVAVILVVSASIYSCIVMFMETQPALLEPYSLARSMDADRQFAKVREALPSNGLIGYQLSTSFNTAEVRELLGREAFKKAYLERLETGKPMDEKIVPIEVFRIMQAREMQLYYEFTLAQLALAPLVLVTKSFDYFEDIVVYSEKFKWDIDEYPDLLVGDFRGLQPGRKIEIPEEYKVSRDFKNGLILFEREK